MSEALHNEADSKGSEALGEEADNDGSSLTPPPLRLGSADQRPTCPETACERTAFPWVQKSSLREWATRNMNLLLDVPQATDKEASRV